MLRTVLLAAAVLLVALPAVASADRAAVDGGVLTLATEPGSALEVASMVGVPCQFDLKDVKTGKITPLPSQGPCLVLTAGQRTVEAGPGCMAIAPDDAMCPLTGVSRVVIRGTDHAETVELIGALQEFGGFGHYYFLGTDVPVQMPVPLEVHLGGGDDTLTIPEESSVLPAVMSCGDGLDTVEAPEKAVWGLDCENSSGFRVGAPGTAGGAAVVEGDTLTWTSPEPGGETSVGLMWHASFRGRPSVSLMGSMPAQLGGGCLAVKDVTCPLVGVKRVRLLGSRRSRTSVSTRNTRDAERAPVPLTIDVDLGPKGDDADLRDELGGRVSCGPGVDHVRADAGDRYEADCERVSGGKGLPGFDLRLPRTGTWERGRSYPANQIPLRATCPASVRDDSCGGKLEAFYKGSYLGTRVYAIERGRSAVIVLGMGVGEGARGQSNLAVEYAAMRRAIQSRRGAKLRLLVKTGGSRFWHPLKLTRHVDRGFRRG